jgi:hypothetical protein
MKKISLKNLNLNETVSLSREQLKNVLGGYSGGTGTSVGLPTGGPNCEFTCECIASDGSYYNKYVSCAGLTSDEMVGLCDSKC